MNPTPRKNKRNALLLPLLLFFLSLFTLCRLPAENLLFPRPLNYKSHYENFYNSSLPCVKVTVPELFSTGMNYQRGSMTQGTFYYTLYDGFCQFYLLPSGNKNDSTSVLTEQTLTGRLIELKESEYDALLSQMAAELQWNTEDLKKRTSPYAVSTLPGSMLFLEFLRVVSLTGLILSAFDLLSLLKNRSA